MRRLFGWLLSFVLILTFYTWFSIPVMAKSDEVVAPELYNVVSQKTLIEALLGDRDPETLSESELEQIVSLAQTSGQVPQVGTISEKDGVYTIRTGLSGTAKGKIAKGEYELQAVSVDEVKVVLPKRVVVGGLGAQLDIQMQQIKGKGIVSYGEGGKSSQFSSSSFHFPILNIRWPWQKKFNPNLVSSANPIGSRAPLTVRLYQDQNGDGVYDDKSDKLVPWANVKITMKKISTEKDMSLQKGTNFIQLDELPRNTPTAAKMMAEVLAMGVKEATLTTVNPGQSLVAKGTEIYGEDFPIQVKTPYQIYLSDPTVLSLMITK